MTENVPLQSYILLRITRHNDYIFALGLTVGGLRNTKIYVNVNVGITRLKISYLRRV